jgi:hypothetical protein
MTSYIHWAGPENSCKLLLSDATWLNTSASLDEIQLPRNPDMLQLTDLFQDKKYCNRVIQNLGGAYCSPRGHT